MCMCEAQSPKRGTHHIPVCTHHPLLSPTLVGLAEDCQRDKSVLFSILDSPWGQKDQL